MAIDFPTSPTPGQQVTSGSRTWTWSGTYWANNTITGVQGTQGIQGTQGTQGVQGIQGLLGTQGSQGLQGIQGIQGVTGAQGITGIQGTQGTQGLQGIMGAQGAQGTQGTQGAQGIQGSQGTQGAQGIQGIQGISGASILGTNNTWTGTNAFASVSATGEIASFGSSGNSSNRLKASYNSTSGLALFGPDSNGGTTSLNIGVSNAGTYNTVLGISTTGLAVTGALSSTTGANFATSSGNVGIGTTAGIQKLTVAGTVDIGFVDTSNLFRFSYDTTNGGSLQSFIGGGVEKMSLNPSGGNVGIGTTSPAYKLDVNGTLNWGLNSYLTSGGLKVAYRAATNNFIYSGSSSLRINNDADDLSLVTVLNSGNVGIGTSSPSSLLDIESSSQTAEISLNQTGAAGRDYRLGSTGSGYGSAGNFIIYDVTAGAERFRINSSGNFAIPAGKYINFNGNATAAEYAIEAATTASPYDFRFIGSSDPSTNRNFSFGYYASNSNASTWNSKFNINSYTGQVQMTNSDGTRFNALFPSRYGYSSSYMALVVGATSGNTTVCINVDPSGNASGAFSGTGSEVMFRNVGSFICPNAANTGYNTIMSWSGSTSATVTMPGSLVVSGTITESSSITLKENLNPITDALNVISNLKGWIYDRKDGTAMNQAGFIAEEVEQVLPNVVSKTEDGTPMGVQYTKIIAYLVESVKELKAQIEVLKK
jgi:hypothetical protein